MALLAGGNFSFGTIMVAGGTAILHFRHAGMQLMVKMNRLILLREFAQEHGIRSFPKLVVSLDMGHGQAGTLPKTHFFGRRHRTRVAIKTVDFGRVIGRLHLGLCGIAHQR